MAETPDSDAAPPGRLSIGGTGQEVMHVYQRLSRLGEIHLGANRAGIH